MLSTSIVWEKNTRCREQFGTAKKPSTASKRRVATRWKIATPRIGTQRPTRRKFWRRRRDSRWLKYLIGSKTDGSATERHSHDGNYCIQFLNFLKGRKWQTVEAFIVAPNSSLNPIIAQHKSHPLKNICFTLWTCLFPFCACCQSSRCSVIPFLAPTCNKRIDATPEKIIPSGSQNVYHMLSCSIVFGILKMFFVCSDMMFPGLVDENFQSRIFNTYATSSSTQYQHHSNMSDQKYQI